MTTQIYSLPPPSHPKSRDAISSKNSESKDILGKNLKLFQETIIIDIDIYWLFRDTSEIQGIFIKH